MLTSRSAHPDRGTLKIWSPHRCLDGEADSPDFWIANSSSATLTTWLLSSTVLRLLLLDSERFDTVYCIETDL